MSSAGADAAGADLLAFLQVDTQKARYKEHTTLFAGVLFQSLLSCQDSRCCDGKTSDP
jgi:hypothetical protein